MHLIHSNIEFNSRARTYINLYILIFFYGNYVCIIEI